MASVSHRLRALAPFLIAAVIVGVDQATKLWVVENLANREALDVFPFLDGGLRLVYSHNTGAVFGILPQTNFALIIIAIVVIVVILGYYRYMPTDSRLVRLSLGLQLGGALGNLTDRLHYGHVVDFVDFGITPGIRWFTFNVADSAIVTGVVVLAYCLLFALPNQGSPASGNEEPLAASPGEEIRRAGDQATGEANNQQMSQPAK